MVRPGVLATLALIFVSVLVASPSPAAARRAATYVVRPAKLLGPVTKQTGCVSRNGKPDRGCTPGAIDPRVTQANLGQTICRRGGYTGSVRPPESYTEALKRSQIPAYGAYRGSSLSDYEEDHLVSLELGGSRRQPGEPLAGGAQRRQLRELRQGQAGERAARGGTAAAR